MHRCLGSQEGVDIHVDVGEKFAKLSEGRGIRSMRAVSDRVLSGDVDKCRKKSMYV